jgi:hypothetical protein
VGHQRHLEEDQEAQLSGAVGGWQRLLKYALAPMAVADRPSWPFHLGGPPPALTQNDELDVLRWIGKRVPAKDVTVRVDAAAAVRVQRNFNHEALHVVEHAVKHCGDVRAFVAELDQEICDAEARAVLREVGPPDAVLARVRWRVGPAGGGRADRFIVLLGDGRYAAIVRAPRRAVRRGGRVFMAGTVDDVLSCVPDHLFADATSAVLGASGSR